MIKAVTDNHFILQNQAENSSSGLGVHSSIFFLNRSDFLGWLLNPGIDILHRSSNTAITTPKNWLLSPTGALPPWENLWGIWRRILWQKWVWITALHQPCKVERESRGGKRVCLMCTDFFWSSYNSHSRAPAPVATARTLCAVLG